MASPETCSRVRDAASLQRLWGDAALLEHATDCEICARELEAQRERRAFRDAFPTLTSIADQSERAPTPGRVNANDARLRASRRHLYVMIAALVAIIGFFGRSSVFRARSTPLQGDEIAGGPPKFRIANIENALFDSKTEGATVRSSMTRGIAAFHVEQLGPDQRFLLILPDGEVEVRGTLFVISIEGGKTKSVEVSEGTVALRLSGRAEMLLSEGQRWPRESEPPTVSFLRLAPRKDAAPPEPAKPND